MIGKNGKKIKNERVIFLVQNGTDFSKLENTIKKFPVHTVYSLDYESHKLLERKKITHKIGEDVLTSADFDAIDLSAINCTKNCFESYKEILTIENIFLAELFEHELFFYLIRQFLNAHVILKVLEKEYTETVIDFTNVGDYVKKITNFKKIKHIHFGIIKPPSLYHDNVRINFNLSKIPINFELSRKTFSRIKKPIQRLTSEIYDLEPNSQNKKNILLLNFDPLQYEELLMEFKKENINFLLLNLRKPAITNKKSLDIIKNSKSKIVDLNKFSKFVKSDIFYAQKNLQNIIEKIFNDDSSFEKLFSVHKFSFWSSIKDQFRDICTSRFQESTERLFLFKKLFSTFDIDTIFVWVEVGQEEKECILMGKFFSIKSVMLQHGRYQTSKKWDKFARFLAYFSSSLLTDKQIIWGEITKQYALSHNHSSNNVLIGGSPRHDKFFNLSSRKNKKTGKILLATTGTMYISADSCTTGSQTKYDEYFKEVYRIVKSLPEKKLVVKPHPGPLLTKYVENLVNEIDPSITVIRNTDLHELINECEVLITFNNSTTALEAISLNKPVISLQTESWANEDDIAQAGAVVSISNIKDCEKEIKKILFDTLFRKQQMDKGSNFLRKYMSNPGKASKSVAEIFKNFTETSK